MEDILKSIYDGEYTFWDCISNVSVNEELNILHQQIIDALIDKYGKEEALNIDERYQNIRSEVIDNEMYQVFKEAYRLAFKLTIAAFHE